MIDEVSRRVKEVALRCGVRRISRDAASEKCLKTPNLKRTKREKNIEIEKFY